MESNLFYNIAISKIPGIGPVHTKHLISKFSSSKNIIQASKKELLSVDGIGHTLADAILAKTFLKEAEAELKWIEKNNINAIFYLDDKFPDKLRYLHDAPILLYTKGECDLLHKRNVAIIGTRNPSHQGISNCEEIVDSLQKYNVQIISGLAYGIDICAHRKALDCNIPTIAVLAHGLNQVYPFSHAKTAAKMIEKGGLVSEFSIKDGPDKEHFPMRNRIVAGLCDALVVVESPIKGGSIITTEFANNYNKDVFAVPGRLQDIKSQGCNRLIKINKAALLESSDDIAYIMRWQKKSTQIKQQKLFIDLDERELKIVDTLRNIGETSFDRLAFEVQSQNSQLATLLLNLEFKGIIKSIPGNRFILI